MRVGAAVRSDERQRLITLLNLDLESGRPAASDYRLFTAWREDDLVGASAWFRAADGSAMLMRPWASLATVPAATELYSAMATDAQIAGCRYALALADPDDPWNEESLTAAQFSRLAEFATLSRRLDGRDSDWPEFQARFVEFTEDLRERFQELFATIQRESDDCLGIRGLRSTDEAFAMFAAAGRFRPEDWLLLEYDSRDAALLLMNETADAAVLEIAFLGVVPELRRRGIGRGLVTEAIQRAAWRDFPKVITAVDVVNMAASHLYDRLGFVETSRHQVFVKHLPAASQCVSRES